MARPATEKQHLMTKYKEITIQLLNDGYGYEEVAVIMNRSRAVIYRIYEDHLAAAK